MFLVSLFLWLSNGQESPSNIFFYDMKIFLRTPDISPTCKALRFQSVDAHTKISPMSDGPVSSTATSPTSGGTKG